MNCLLVASRWSLGFWIDAVMNDPDRGSGRAGRDVDLRAQLPRKRIDDTGSETGLGAGGVGRHADTVVGDGESPAGAVGLVAHQNLAFAHAREGVLERALITSSVTIRPRLTDTSAGETLPSTSMFREI